MSGDHVRVQLLSDTQPQVVLPYGTTKRDQSQRSHEAARCRQALSQVFCDCIKLQSLRPMPFLAADGTVAAHDTAECRASLLDSFHCSTRGHKRNFDLAWSLAMPLGLSSYGFPARITAAEAGKPAQGLTSQALATGFVSSAGGTPNQTEWAPRAQAPSPAQRCWALTCWAQMAAIRVPELGLMQQLVQAHHLLVGQLAGVHVRVCPAAHLVDQAPCSTGWLAFVGLNRQAWLHL